MKIEWEIQDIYSGRRITRFNQTAVWMMCVRYIDNKEFYFLVNLVTGITSRNNFPLKDFVQSLNDDGDFIPVEIQSESKFHTGSDPDLIYALKQIHSGAKTMILGWQENTKIYARDIKTLAEAALQGKEIPKYFTVRGDNES